MTMTKEKTGLLVVKGGVSFYWKMKPYKVVLLIVLFSGLSVQNPNSASRVPGGEMMMNLLRRAEYV